MEYVIALCLSDLVFLVELITTDAASIKGVFMFLDFII